MLTDEFSSTTSGLFFRRVEPIWHICHRRAHRGNSILRDNGLSKYWLWFGITTLQSNDPNLFDTEWRPPPAVMTLTYSNSEEWPFGKKKQSNHALFRKVILRNYLSAKLEVTTRPFGMMITYPLEINKPIQQYRRRLRNKNEHTLKLTSRSLYLVVSAKATW